MHSVDEEISYLKENLCLNKGDIIYVLTHKKKMSVLEWLVDFISGGIVDVFHSYHDGVYRYLVATAQSGIIYNISSNYEITQVTKIDNWNSQQKDSFKSITIDDIKYRNIRKVMVK